MADWIAVLAVVALIGAFVIAVCVHLGKKW